LAREMDEKMMSEINTDSKHIFLINGYLQQIKSRAENIFYSACPVCKKKISQDINGFKCEKCNKIF
jgi:hypothetical protein